MVIQVQGKESSSLPASSGVLVVLRFRFSLMRISDSFRAELAMFKALTDFGRGTAGCDLCEADLRKADCALKHSAGGGAG